MTSPLRSRCSTATRQYTPRSLGIDWIRTSGPSGVGDSSEATAPPGTLGLSAWAWRQADLMAQDGHPWCPTEHSSRHKLRSCETLRWNVLHRRQLSTTPRCLRGGTLRARMDAGPSEAAQAVELGDKSSMGCPAGHEAAGHLRRMVHSTTSTASHSG